MAGLRPSSKEATCLQLSANSYWSRRAALTAGPARRLVRSSPEGEGGSLGEGGRAAPPTRFLLLRDGGVYFDGAPTELLAARDEYVRRFLA